MSAEPYELTVAETTVVLSPTGDDGRPSGTVSVEVTSHLDRHDNVMLKVVASGSTSESWFRVEPSNQFLQIGNTITAVVTANPPPGVEPGSYPFAVGAYAESSQQRDFALSDELSVEIPDPAQPARSIPLWLIAAGAAVLVVGVILAFVLGGGDDGPEDDVVGPEVDETAPSDTTLAPDVPVADLIGLPVAEAGAAFGGTLDIYTDRADPGDDQCVLLQTPVAGTLASTVAVLTTTCPTPAPEPVLPASLDNECAASFSFCDEVASSFPEPLTNAGWQAAKLAMVATFIERFSIPGVETPTVVGLPLVEARAASSTPDSKRAISATAPAPRPDAG